MIDNATTRNPKNLLDGLTPTFAGWSVNPGTNANLVNELTTALTTPGVQPNNVACDIVYDLGVSLRFLVFVVRGTVATAGTITLYTSDDNATWYYLGHTGAASTTRPAYAVGKARYIKATFASTAVGNTISDLTLRAYRL